MSHKYKHGSRQKAMNKLQNLIHQNKIFQLFEPFIPGDHHKTWTAADYARSLLERREGPVRVLDLGCGAGHSRDFFRSINAQCSWHGAEVEGSPELLAEGVHRKAITFFDGVNLPWEDGAFDLVYTNQVLEHVRKPDALLADVFRVLKPGGALVGSVSYLEPYHSLSLFNYTPYGLITVLRDAGFHVAELRPGHDYWSVILRQMLGGGSRISTLLRWVSPFNSAVRMLGGICRLDSKIRNFLKIQFAGHICFLAYKKVDLSVERLQCNTTDAIKKIGILWGGGLGDLLMIRPLLAAAHADTRLATYFCTSASHATELYQEFCAPTTVVQFPRNVRELLPAIKKWRHFFDLLYLGPYPSLKTRMLAHLLQPEKIWSKRHVQAQPFLLEQILCDCAALGLRSQRAAKDFISFLPWQLDSAMTPFPEKQPFVVMHAGAKQRWKTTRWPAENWAVLTKKVLDETSFGICFVGVASEEPIIAQIMAGLTSDRQGRIRRFISLPVRDTAQLISESRGVICHNSGILHLSTFLGKKTVCITGSSARYWQPPYPWVKNITSTACTRACNRYTCAMPFYRAKCIKSIPVENVWQAIREHGLLEEAE